MNISSKKRNLFLLLRVVRRRYCHHIAVRPSHLRTSDLNIEMIYTVRYHEVRCSGSVSFSSPKTVGF